MITFTKYINERLQFLNFIKYGHCFLLLEKGLPHGFCNFKTARKVFADKLKKEFGEGIANGLDVVGLTAIRVGGEVAMHVNMS